MFEPASHQDLRTDANENVRLQVAAPLWRESLEGFLNRYGWAFSSCLLVGSLAYREFRKNSDVDLVVVLKDVESWGIIAKELANGDSQAAARFADESLASYRKGKSQYFCLNFERAGIPLSVDFLPPDFFARAMSDLDKGQTVVYQRVTDTPITDGYEFGSGARRISPEKKNTIEGSCVFVSTPLCLVEGDFFLGLHLDKLLTGYRCLLGDDRDAMAFCVQGIKAMLKIGRPKDLQEVMMSLNRYERLPARHVREQIERFSRGHEDSDRQENAGSLQ